MQDLALPELEAAPIARLSDLAHPLEAARAEAERIREEARREGFEAGMAEAHLHLAPAASALSEAAAALGALDAELLADVEQAAAELVRVLREVRPQVVITYDDNGGYGHPDHIQAHRVTVRAFDAAADPAFAPEAGEPWQASKLYCTAMPKSFLQAGIDHLKEQGDTEFFGVDSADDLPFGVPDEQITTEIDARAFLGAKMDAMRAHATQIALDGPFFALSNNIGQQAMGVEHFILLRGELAPSSDGRETDLFAGL